MRIFAPLLVTLAIFLTGCADGPYLLATPGASIRDDVKSAGWGTLNIKTDVFDLTGFYKKPFVRAETLHVYIEGDGDAFDAAGNPKLNPTPDPPMALNMAVNDPNSAVLYLGRPCQYPTASNMRNCQMKYWTFHRFGKTVIRSTNQAISAFKKKVGAKNIVLVGYSGGGAVAAIAAAHRKDVTGLITVAGTLDHGIWTRHHDVGKLYGSLNPVDFVRPLSRLSQTHFVGLDDEIMPPLVAGSYMSALKHAAPERQGTATVIKVPGYSHTCCWAENWSSLLKQAEMK